MTKIIPIEHRVLRALLKNDGRSYEAIAADVGGLTRQRVQQIAKKNGITRRRVVGVMRISCEKCGHLTPAVPSVSTARPSQK